VTETSVPSTTQPPKSPLASSLTRYRVLAWVTGVLLLLLTLHVVLQVVQFDGTSFSWSGVFEEQGLDVVVPGAGHLIPLLHGWFYLLYVLCAIDLWLRTRLPFVRSVLVVLAGTVPTMSFVAERWVTHRVRPMVAAVHPVAD
jgi:integral membrane protein